MSTAAAVVMLGFVTAISGWALWQVVGSRACALTKGVWVAVITLVPVLGFVVWLLAGPRRRRREK